MTPWRYTGLVKAHPRWATVYFDPATHRALRLKAAGTDRSVSELINEAVSLSLLEHAEDLAAFEQRAHEPSIRFAEAARNLTRRGK